MDGAHTTFQSHPPTQFVERCIRVFFEKFFQTFLACSCNLHRPSAAVGQWRHSARFAATLFDAPDPGLTDLKLGCNFLRSTARITICQYPLSQIHRVGFHATPPVKGWAQAYRKPKITDTLKSELL
jgi:hypothetical protein